jgi:hypothetical protein
VWPKNKAAGLAYIDQLERSQAIGADQIKELRNAVEAKNLNQTQVAKLTDMLTKNAGKAKSPADVTRFQAIAELISQGTIGE